MRRIARPLLGLSGAQLHGLQLRCAVEVPLEKLRNFGISAHIDSGKTTLTERILFYTGKINKIHEVHGKDGVGAVMDSMKEERERGITIKSAATFSTWKDTWLNIIDTPGHIDFTVEVERSLRVLDGAVLVVCAVGGVQSQTVTVDRQMKRYDVPRIIFINKLDRKETKEMGLILEEIRGKLGLNAAFVQIPNGVGRDPLGCQGVVDLMERKSLSFSGFNGTEIKEGDCPKELVEEMEERRAHLVETLADVDETIGDKFLEDEEPTLEELHAAIRKGVIARTFVPIFVGTAKGNIGVQPLLDGVSRYLPNPHDVTNRGIVVKDGVEEEVILKSDPKSDLVAMAFKIDIKNKRPLNYVRVYQGTLRKGDSVRLAPRGSANWKEAKTAKITKLVRMHSNDVEEVDRLRSGEIGGVEGLECSSGDTLVNAMQKTVVSCESIFVPAPVISIQIFPRQVERMQDLINALMQFKREDPTFQFSVDTETKDLTIAGMGELHLEVFTQRLKSEFGLEVTSGKPFVQFREYIPMEPDQQYPFDYRHKRQSGGRGQFAQLSGYLRMREVPLTTKDTQPKVSFVNDQIGGALPDNFVKSIQKAFEEVCEKGPLLGAPVWGLEMVLTGGQTHEVDSSDFAFNIATKDLLVDMFEQLKATLVEPIMEVEITIPSGNAPEVQGLVTERMGDVLSVKPGIVDTTINAHVALRQMFGFVSDLRALTKGMGDFSMEYDHHAPVQHYESQNIISERQDELARRKNLSK